LTFSLKMVILYFIYLPSIRWSNVSEPHHEYLLTKCFLIVRCQGIRMRVVIDCLGTIKS
jgi:hypothetical protein